MSIAGEIESARDLLYHLNYVHFVNHEMWANENLDTVQVGSRNTGSASYSVSKPKASR